MKKFRVISTCVEVEKIDIYAKTKEEAEELVLEGSYNVNDVIDKTWQDQVIEKIEELE
jgi:hypothetical protein